MIQSPELELVRPACPTLGPYELALSQNTEEKPLRYDNRHVLT